MDRWLAAVLAEYASLREESLRAIEAQHTTLRYGMTGVAVVIGIGLKIAVSDVPDEVALGVAFLALVVPILTILVTGVWQGEIWRMTRAGAYLRQTERRVNTQAVSREGIDPMGWEQWLATMPTLRHRGYHRAAFAILTFVSAGSVLLGAHYTVAVWGWWVAAGITVGGLVITAYGSWRYIRRARMMKAFGDDAQP